MDSLVTYGAAFYRNLLWEASWTGQVRGVNAFRTKLNSHSFVPRTLPSQRSCIMTQSSRVRLSG
jgi:hypothetical protein